MPVPLLVVICGPTAVGKTAVAAFLAKYFHTAVVSADSRQLYREIPIGTAQPSTEELQIAPHRLVASHSIHEALDAGSYSRECHRVLAEEFSRNPVVIMAGGSGLYIDAVINGFDELPERDEKLRAALQEAFAQKGIAYLQQELRELDPVYYEKVDRSNHSRLIRAIEVCRLTGKPYSSLRSGEKDEQPFHVVKIGLEMPRADLYARINRRVLLMMEEGLEAEARAVYPYRKLGPLHTVGYKELFDHFDGTISREKAVELIQQHTRNYAKRQVTWWRKDTSIHWFAPSETEKMIQLVEQAAR
jgi:tRNA dimethylallyltransferase